MDTACYIFCEDIQEGLEGSSSTLSWKVITSFAEYLEEWLQERKISKTDIAMELGYNYKTFVSKFKAKSFTAEEMLIIAKLLNIDLNELRDHIEPEERMDSAFFEHVANNVEEGRYMGIAPDWEIQLEDMYLYPLSKEERSQIAKELDGCRSEGMVNGRSWALKIGS